jgi:hypothetical protein
VKYNLRSSIDTHGSDASSSSTADPGLRRSRANSWPPAAPGSPAVPTVAAAASANAAHQQSSGYMPQPG